MATLRDKGLCPCPRCLVRTSEIPELGTAADRARRETSARHDDAERRDKVKTAVSLIYDKGYAVNSVHVENELKEQSLIPTEVCAWPRYLSKDVSHLRSPGRGHRMHSRTLSATSLSSSSWISYTSSSWVCGRPSSPT